MIESHQTTTQITIREATRVRIAKLYAQLAAQLATQKSGVPSYPSSLKRSETLFSDVFANASIQNPSEKENHQQQNLANLPILRARLHKTSLTCMDTRSCCKKTLNDDRLPVVSVQRSKMHEKDP